MAFWDRAYHWRFDPLGHYWECWLEYHPEVDAVAMHSVGWVTAEVDEQSHGLARRWFVERLGDRIDPRYHLTEVA